MANPTQAQIDKLTVNSDRWDDVINGTAAQTVQLDDFSVQTLAGILDELKTYNITGAWAGSTVYAVKDVAEESGIQYVALVAHTANVFATDLAAGKWGILQIDFTSNVFLTGDFTVDTTTFKVDSVNNKVYVGTTSPVSLNSVGIGKFQVESDLFTALNIVTHNNSAGNFSFLNLVKARGTNASPTIVANNDTIGTFSFDGYDGAAYRACASIQVSIDGVPSAADIPGRMEFYTVLDGGTMQSLRMTIKNDGKIGMGIGSPSVELDVLGDIRASSMVFIGSELTNSFMTVGLTINQGSTDNEIVSFKSSDIAHTVTSFTEADTYGLFQKASATAGGLNIVGLTEAGDKGVFIRGIAEGAHNTAKTTAGTGIVDIISSGVSGASNGDVDADANILTVSCNRGGGNPVVFIVDEDGDLFADGGTSSTNMVTQFDEYDDIELLRAFELVRHKAGAKGLIRNEFDSFVMKNEDDLVRLGILGAPLKEGGLINITRLQQLQTGALCQLGVMFKRMEYRLKLTESRVSKLQLQGA